MKAWKPLALITGYIFLIVSVSAQGLGGAEMTVGESLTTFVTEVLGFPVDDVSEVLIFVVGPIFAFYFFLTNMMTMAFENFEDRIGRDEWDKKEELPTNLKLFSLVTAFITVVTIGRIAPGLILIFGALALILGILMMGGLLTRDGDNGGNDDGNGGGDGGNGNSDGGGGGNSQNNDNGATRADYIERIADAGETITSGVRDRADQQIEDQRKEALRYFQSDFLGEFEECRNRITSDIRPKYNQAENEMINADSIQGNFKAIKDRAGDVFTRTEKYKNNLESDIPLGNYAGSNLEDAINTDRSNDRGLDVQLRDLKKKLESILGNTRTSPPTDVFDEVHEDIPLILAVGHFFHHYPEEIDSPDKAQECLEVAASKGLYSLPPAPSDIQELVNLYDSGFSNQVHNLVTGVEKLASKEISLTESEIEDIKDLTGSTGRAMNNITYILNEMGGYTANGNFSGHKTYLENMREFIAGSGTNPGQIENLIDSLEASLGSDEKFETQMYKELKKLEEKI